MYYVLRRLGTNLYLARETGKYKLVQNIEEALHFESREAAKKIAATYAQTRQWRIMEIDN